MNCKALAYLLMVGLSCNSIAAGVKKSIYTPTAPAPIGTYSQGMQFNDVVYLSGQIGIDPKTGELVPGTFNDQLKQVFLNISEVTKAAGGSVDDIIKLTIFVTDLNNFNAVNEMMKTYFHEPFPARSVVEIKALPKNASVEIEAVMGLGEQAVARAK